MANDTVSRLDLSRPADVQVARLLADSLPDPAMRDLAHAALDAPKASVDAATLLLKRARRG